MWLMKTLLTSGCTNQRGAGQTTNVNEQNEQAVGFYQKMGFRVTGRSETDDLGQPYPLLNLMYEQQAEADYD
ncbi:GNAT family N-acetyltransferase [Klebsiella pneumoniae]|uniref:GNAT family N-acetyltransferase n=1 Tax=Klebsiella pneumoniae TaxID=573 RepID=UPI00226B8544|nr:GNAT family N-acetyltransferase [Klebsiella pneumoniae]